jgi:hypothetical protein
VDRGVTGAAPDGEVVGADQHRAPVDAGGARDEVGGHHRAEPALLVVVGESGERADLGETSGVGQAVDALPDGEPARGTLPCHFLRAAHGLRRLAAAADLLDFRHPALPAGFRPVACSAHQRLAMS